MCFCAHVSKNETNFTILHGDYVQNAHKDYVQNVE